MPRFDGSRSPLAMISHPARPEGFGDDVRKELQRILGSPLFSRAPQASHLLAFLVEEALSSDPAKSRESLKEYSIAVKVFRRPESFDSNIDNIVRVEIRRLRGKLERYYKREGAADPLVITIPKGSYLPRFHERDSSETDLSGQTVSHYELVRRRCANRWQATYDANCLHLHRHVIVILPTRYALEDEGRPQALLSDTSRAAAIDHPNVAAIHDVEVDEGRITIATAPLPGRSLRQYVESGALSPHLALQVAKSLAGAIAAGHSAAIFHGNLNPLAVTLEEVGTGSDLSIRTHVLPFGLSLLVDINSEAFDGFTPPEWKVSRNPDFRSDVWSFGALVWLACYGSAPPEEVSSSSTTVNGATSGHVLLPLLTRCLNPDPAARFNNGMELLEAVNAIPEPSPERLGSEFRTKTPFIRNRVLPLTAALLATLLIVLVTIIRLRLEPSPGAHPRVVVLPFRNADPEQPVESYRLMAAEVVATRLAKLPNVQVVSPRSLDPQKTDRFPMDFLRNELHVDYAFDGSVLRSNSRFQVTIGLIHVADGSYAWTDSLSGDWPKLNSEMQQLAEKAAAAMSALIQQQRKTQQAKLSAAALAGNDAWQKGRFAAFEYVNTRRVEYYDDAERRLLQALELEPAHVGALADLAQLYINAAYPAGNNQAELLEKAERFAERAVTLDPLNATAQAILGSVYTETSRPLRALPHLYRAIQLGPDDPAPHNSMSLAYEALGFWESSIAERQLSAARDPLLRGIRTGGYLLLPRLGRSEEAIQIVSTLETGSHDWGIRLAYIQLLDGKPKLAEATLMQIKSRSPPDLAKSWEVMLSLARALQGQPGIARAAVKKYLIAQRRRTDTFVLLCAVAGDGALLVEQISMHPYIRNYRWLTSEPLLRPYRSYAPFQELARTLHSEWERNLKKFGSFLPVQPPSPPSVERFLTQN